MINNISQRKAKRVLVVYGIGVLFLLLILYTPFSIPCIFKLVTNIPCPGCGITRAFVLASRFDFIGATKSNILFPLLAVGGAIKFICACIDLFFKKSTSIRFDAMLNKKWVIALAFVMVGLSWYYNITQ